MKTYFEKTIKNGIRRNSMFEPNTVKCKSTKEELEKFYEDTEGLTPKLKILKPNAMKTDLPILKRKK